MSLNTKMSLSHDLDLVASDSEPQHSAQADQLLGSRSSSNSLNSDDELDVNVDSSVRSNSPQPPQKPVPADVDMENEDEDSDDEDESEHELEMEEEQTRDRPNKYHGPASTWRSWTEQERMLAASLDQIRAADLSIHLYNAHAMKRRLRTREQQDRVPSWGNKERWIGTGDGSEELGDGEAGVSVFVPPKVWTAWPMPPDEVPGEGEKKFGRREDEDERWTLRRRGTGTASEELQELLVAEVQKRAKERFHKREWEDFEGDAAEAAVKLEASSKRPRRRSAWTAKNDEDVSESKEIRHMKPVVMADDEQARGILQPTVRHILTKLDGLLMGLHHARQAYVPTGDDTASETQTDMEETSPAPRKKKVKPRKRSLRTLKKRGEESDNTKPESDSDSDSNFSDSFTKSPSPPRPRSRRRRRTPLSPVSAALSQQKRQKRLGLRDWSDVLGVGSMVGWDSAVVRRAAERCAGLFGEGISFRTLEQGKHEDSELEYGCYGTITVERQGQVNERDEVDNNKTFNKSKSSVGRAEDGLYYCSLIDCKQNQKGFSRTWNLNKHIWEMHSDVEFPSNVEDKEEVVGGIHVDGFLKPIPARRGWRSKDAEKRKRKTKLNAA